MLSQITAFFKSGVFALLAFVIVVFVVVLIIGEMADGAGVVKKQQLPRLDPYYEIVNDAGDHGNFIELYRVPTPDGRKVFCIVYSDQIQKSGGGAGISCDWAGAR